jgi:hypothetical protein
VEENGIALQQVNWIGLGIVDSNRLFTNQAYLLSDQNDTRIIVNTFRSDGSLLQSQRETGPILEQMQRLRKRLDDINVPILNKDTGRQQRETLHPWPEISLREALTNCTEAGLSARRIGHGAGTGKRARNRVG